MTGVDPTQGASAVAGDAPRPSPGGSFGAGSVLAGRYRLDALIGVGGFGQVWQCRDQLSGDDVALKIMSRWDGKQLDRVRREVTALRLLQLPGVARLLDDGVDGTCWFLVMELVHGRPFPGPLSAPVPWAKLADMVLGLLETMGRVHAAGIVHRDLKPSNVLVTDDLRPIVLDFGLARGPAVGATITDAGAVLGTPAYLPPEQILGEPAGARADLYALGLMLYEALAGHLPQTSGDLRALWTERLGSDAPPLRQVADVPRHVADVVDALLSREPADRPGSASEVVEALQRRGATTSRHELPWLGGDAAVDALVNAALAGRSARLEGPSGAGHSRCLHRAAERLRAHGHTVVAPVPAGRPFDSVLPLLPQVAAPDSLEGMVYAVDEALGALLAPGTAVVVDRVLALDPWSRAALIRAADRGAVLSTDPDAGGEPVVLQRLTERDLRQLFHGPDRLLHLAEDAARELRARTDGLPARVNDELGAWVRAGLARWDAGRLAVDRQTLDTLESGLRVTPVWVAPRVAKVLTVSGSAPSRDGGRPRAAHRELLTWVGVAWPRASAPVLAEAMGEPPWRVQAELQELEERGLLVLDGAGAGTPTAAAVHAGSAWTDAQLRDAHARLAAPLPRGTDGRLRHLVAAGDEHTFVAEAAAIAAERRTRGALRAAAVVATAGLAAARAEHDADGEELLLDALTRVALLDGSTAAVERALYEVGRATRSRQVAALEQLLRATRTVCREVGARALARVEAMAPFDDVELECARQEARVRAARGLEPEAEDRIIADAVRWAHGFPEVALRGALWEGHALYRRARYEEAAALQARAAQAAAPLVRLRALLDGAASLLEAGRHGDAEALAQQARTVAATLRHPLPEGQAEWLVRAAAYRQGHDLEPDEELVAAAGQLAMPHFEAQVCFGESAFALRRGQRDVAAQLAGRAATLWRASGRRWEPALAAAVAGACGARPGDVQERAAEAVACPVDGFGLQILGLLACEAGPLPGWEDAARRLAAIVPAARWSQRIDVLSVDEALGALRGAWTPPGRPLTGP